MQRLQPNRGRGLLSSWVLGAVLGTSPLLAGAIGLSGQEGQGLATQAGPSPWLAIDRNRGTVIERIVTQWGEAVAASDSGIDRAQFRQILDAMRADQLLAASLAGSLDGLRSVVVSALTAQAADGAPATAKALGDATQDVVYVPVTPCRLVETRGTFAAVYQGGGAFPGGTTRTYTLQGGNGVCLSQLPASATPGAVQLQVFGIPTSSASGDIEVLPQGGAFGATASLVYLGNNAFTSAAVTSLVNVANKQISVQVRGGGAHVAIDVVGYFRAPGNILLANSTSAAAGNIMKPEGVFLHNHGDSNTFGGVYAGNFSVTGYANTGFGRYALNSATTADLSTAVGTNALANTTSGDKNTAIGTSAMQNNTLGFENAALGAYALSSSTGADRNLAAGYFSLRANLSGNDNTAVGNFALAANTSGDSNIAIGSGAGAAWTSGDWNIAMAHAGVDGDSNTIRIGIAANHARTFIAGIRAKTTGIANAIPVVIDSAGQLGTVSSSRTVKDDIADMGEASASLMQLRPVTFHYKQDPSRTLQYGLVAEEVAQTMPALVAHDGDGNIETVMYQYLAPMLLNEYQKQQRTIAAQEERLAAYERERAAYAARQAALASELAELRRSVETLVAEARRNASVAAVR